MRNPSDLPPRGTRGPRRPQFKVGRPGKGRIVLIGIVLALLLLLVFAKSLSGWYMNLLWHDSQGRGDVFWSVLRTKVMLVAVSALFFMVFTYVNLMVADKLAPAMLGDSPQDRAIAPIRAVQGKARVLVRLLVAFIFGLFVGLPAASQWSNWTLFRHQQSFGIKDPQFNTDIGFYVFRLPFLQYLVGWLFGAVVLATILTAVAHLLNGGIRPQAVGNRLSTQAKVHLSVLLAIMALLRAASYWLARFDLTRSTRGVVQGATYTDVKAQLPATNLMILVSIAVALLLLWNVRQRGWRLPVMALGLWVVVALIAGTVYPAIIQRIVVQPNVSTRELPYIQRNIDATRAALGLDKVEVEEISFSSITTSDVVANDAALRDVRQLEPTQMRDRFALDQGKSSFFAVRDLDVDRYSIDGRVQQVLLATRELNPEGVPNNTWVSRNLSYTHGCGVVAAPMSVVTADGRPEYIDLGVERPEIYFGDGLGGYSVVKTEQQEQACDTDAEPQAYQGDLGIKLDSPLRRIAAAINFGEYNLFGSRLITEDSQLLWVRDIKSRVSKLAPFLEIDTDPYPVVLDGKIFWVVDLFTTTNRYPYAQRANTDQLSSASGLNKDFNYARNSVKAVVDAYTGEVSFYVSDSTDPIARAWAAAFPKLFKGIEEAPEGLEDHVRYPEDLFRVQSNMWGKYQFEDATLFFNRDKAWSVAQAPPIEPEGVATAIGSPSTSIVNADTADVAEANVERFEPYYTIFHAPGGDRANDIGVFSMLRPFVPFSANDSRKELRGFMVVSSDPDNFGQIVVYSISDPLPPGPASAAAEFESDPTISQEITPLDLRGSRVIFGDLQLVPVGKGIVYIRPVFVQPDDTASQQIFVRKILASYNNRPVMANSVSEAIARLFPGFDVDLGDRTGSAPTTTIPGTEPNESDTPAELLAKADQLFAEADLALQESPPDFATFQAKQAEAREYIERALELLNS